MELELGVELESEVWGRLEMVQMCWKVLEMWSRGVEVQKSGVSEFWSGVQRCGGVELENGDVESEFVGVQRCRIGVSEFRSRGAEVWRKQSVERVFRSRCRGSVSEFRSRVWR